MKKETLQEKLNIATKTLRWLVDNCRRFEIAAISAAVVLNRRKQKRNPKLFHLIPPLNILLLLFSYAGGPSKLLVRCCSSTRAVLVVLLHYLLFDCGRLLSCSCGGALLVVSSVYLGTLGLGLGRFTRKRWRWLGLRLGIGVRKWFLGDLVNRGVVDEKKVEPERGGESGGDGVLREMVVVRDRTGWIGSVIKAMEGKHVAAGWPSWLAVVAGEAIKGWLPRRVDSFEKFDKIGQGTYNNVIELMILSKEIFLYIVFEYIEHDLAGLASHPGLKFTEAQVKCYMEQLLRGLDHCHNCGSIGMIIYNYNAIFPVIGSSILFFVLALQLD
ncbi:hypothetical protein Fmac_008688 [Flemingia macrophylla]|uniref:Protein kinase domain-containing protein n=1 Tax=Flemingia macrophylla TaxID=520843 RepID=A0ABD1MY68_9FABA